MGMLEKGRIGLATCCYAEGGTISIPYAFKKVYILYNVHNIRMRTFHKSEVALNHGAGPAPQLFFDVYCILFQTRCFSLVATSYSLSMQVLAVVDHKGQIERIMPGQLSLIA
jgi:hypothetical protein